MKAKKIVITGEHVHIDDVGHCIRLDLECGSPQICIYIVWTIGRYKNGHPMFNIRAVTTDMVKATMYSKMLRRDKETNGEDWYRVHIESRVANHLYGESMNEFTEHMRLCDESRPKVRPQPTPSTREEGRT